MDSGRVEYGITGDTRRGNQVQIPRIVAVEMPSEAAVGSTVEATVHIVVPDGQAGQSGADRETEITRTIRFIVPKSDVKAAKESGDEMTFQLAYVASDCRVASRKALTTVKPAVRSRSG